MNDDSCVRRERHRKAEWKKLIEEARAALPVYNLEQIRQYRLPFHEAMLANLLDRGYPCTSKYIEHLFDFQRAIREKAGPLSQVYARPQLCKSKAELTELRDLLIKAEDCRNDNNFKGECEQLLKTAVRFAFTNVNWWWLGEQLLLHSLEVSSDYTFLYGKYEALTRYVYGMFLMDVFKNPEAAMAHLNVARHLSRGKEWTTKVIFPEDDDVLYLKVNLMLFNCLITQVEILMDTNYVKASNLATVARRRAAEACFLEGEIKALMLKGMCQLSYNDTKAAIITFTKAYYTQLKLGSAKGICESRIHIAMAYLLDGNAQLSLSTLLMLKESAEEFNVPYYLAQSYRHLGEYFLNKGEASKATLLLAQSCKVFHEHDFVKEADQGRNLEAISTGLELFPEYITLLWNSQKPVPLMELIDWKDSRKKFSEESEEVDQLSLGQIIRESTMQLQESVRHGIPSFPKDMVRFIEGSSASIMSEAARIPSDNETTDVGTDEDI